MFVLLELILIALIVRISDKLWLVEDRHGRTLLSSFFMTVFVGTIWFAMLSDAKEIDQVIPWISISSGILLLKWLHATMLKGK